MASARDPRISEIFYYFEEHTTIASGRTAGRKIGVVQEILVKKLLHTSPRLIDGIVYEPRVPGRSGATHKVEFVFFQPIVAAVLKPQSTWSARDPKGLSVTLRAAGGNKPSVEVTYQRSSAVAAINIDRVIPPRGPCAALARDGFAIKTSHAAGGLRIAVLDMRKPVCSIESKRVGAQRFSSTSKLGSGIQTIEKAKQASLVAIDFDLLFNGNRPLVIAGRAAARAYKSIVVLGNGVHWTAHDRAILQTYVDNTYLAADSAIIRYAEYVRRKAEKAHTPFFEFFMAYFNGMTKTPSDDFVVTEADFPPVAPDGSDGLLAVTDRQMKPFEVQ